MDGAHQHGMSDARHVGDDVEEMVDAVAEVYVGEARFSIHDGIPLGHLSPIRMRCTVHCAGIGFGLGDHT